MDENSAFEAWSQTDDDIQALADERDALVEALGYTTGARRAALEELVYEVQRDIGVLVMKLENICGQ